MAIYLQAQVPWKMEKSQGNARVSLSFRAWLRFHLIDNYQSAHCLLSVLKISTTTITLWVSLWCNAVSWKSDHLSTALFTYHVGNDDKKAEAFFRSVSNFCKHHHKEDKGNSSVSVYVSLASTILCIATCHQRKLSTNPFFLLSFGTQK